MAKDSENSSLLFICHESSRTGAPLILLNFLKWIKKNTDLHFIVIIRKGGELDDEFRALAPVLILYPVSSSFFLLKWPARFLSVITTKMRIGKFITTPLSLVYSNTFSNGELAAYLKRKYSIKLITHVHELKDVIDSLGPDNLNYVKQSSDCFIAASQAVKNVLREDFGIPEKAITVVYEFLVSFEGDTVIPASILKTIKENNKRFVVGAVGFVDTRKGFDLFLDTARRVIIEYKHKEVFFLWAGDFGRGKKKMADDFIKLNHLEGHVLFTGPVKNPTAYYNTFNLVFLPSREDPFPLAMIESAWNGKPVICFRDSGGMPEFIDDDSGLLVDEFNTTLAAEKIIEAAGDPGRLLKLGDNAKRKVENLYRIENAAPVLLGIINNYLK